MKFLLVSCLLLAVASASVMRESHGWQKARPVDMSKYKPRDRKLPVTPNPSAHIRNLIGKLIPKDNRPAPPKQAPTKPKADDCGIMGNTFSTHIVGGEQAKPHQFPWQVGLFLDEQYFCGGSIIDSEWILTAAHCADGISSFRVVIGAHDIRDTSEEGHVETTSREGYVHPEWDSFNLANDIALIHVPKITFNDYARPICLPSKSEVGESFEGETMTVSGWGRESDASGSIARFLNFVSVPVISNPECDAIYGIIGDGILCVDTEGGRGTCNGDSGGPLVMRPQGETAFNQYGVVSFGASAGCEAGYPAGFTRVTEYLDFISDTTGLIL